MGANRGQRQLIHAFNSLWFGKIRIAGPARANLLVFRKQGFSVARFAPTSSSSTGTR